MPFKDVDQPLAGRNARASFRWNHVASWQWSGILCRDQTKLHHPGLLDAVAKGVKLDIPPHASARLSHRLTSKTSKAYLRQIEGLKLV